MLKNKIIESDWSKLLGEDRRFRLVSFIKKYADPSWEDWIEKELKKWGSDDPALIRKLDNPVDQANYLNGRVETMAQFKKKTKNEYIDFIEYRKKWLGIFLPGDEITLVSYLPNKQHVLMATVDENNKNLRDHTDLELWIYEEVSGLFKKHKRYQCLGYTSGTISVHRGSIEHQMGERSGERKVYHEKIRTYNLSYQNGTLMIDDARLERVT